MSTETTVTRTLFRVTRNAQWADYKAGFAAELRRCIAQIAIIEFGPPLDEETAGAHRMLGGEVALMYSGGFYMIDSGDNTMIRIWAGMTEHLINRFDIIWDDRDGTPPPEITP